MPALAIVMLVGGAFLIRQVLVGRAKDTPSDLRDAALALTSGDTKELASVMARRGSNTGVGTDSTSVGGSVDGSLSSGSVPTLSPFGSTALAAEVVKLGEAASGYVIGATGPNYYDCSGLVWKACKTLGIYTGMRFTTSSFSGVAPRFAYKVAAPTTGDIVLWPHHHMGVMVSDSDFYSARSPSKGIGSAPLAADIAYFHGTPEYWRITLDVSQTAGGKVVN